MWSALSTMPTLPHLSPQVPDFAILSRLHLSTSLVLYALLVCCVYCFLSAGSSWDGSPGRDLCALLTSVPHKDKECPVLADPQ